MRQPLVSVVIPTKGRPKLLLRTIESVLAQTFQNFEIVVVIDGPDPDTVLMLQEFGHSKIRFFELPTSVGGSEVRNIGARASFGEWIALLDDDDEWLPLKLERQVDAARSAGTNNLLMTCRFLYKEDGRPDRVGPGKLPDGSVPLVEYLFSPHGGFQTSTFFCSKEVLLRVPFQKGLKGLQDIDWMVRIAADRNIKIVVLPDVLSIYYAPLRRNSVTQKLSWRDRFDWGRSHRNLLSRKEYALFLQQFCLKRAKADKASIKEYCEILQETVKYGSVDVPFFARSAAVLLFSEPLRQGLRHRIKSLLGSEAQ